VTDLLVHQNSGRQLYATSICQNTPEHVQIIIHQLIDGPMPDIEEVSSTIGELLRADADIKWGVGDLLVALHRRAGGSRDDWVQYVKQVASMIPNVGYHTLWTYYATALMFPEEKRIEDKAFSWHVELMHLAGHQLPRSGWSQEEHEAERIEKVAELLETAAEEDWSLSRVRQERLESPRDGLEFTVPIPGWVDVVDSETGEAEQFLVFGKDAPVKAAKYVLGCLRIQSGRHEPIEIRESHGCLWSDGNVVAYLGTGKLAQRAWQKVKGKVVGG